MQPLRELVGHVTDQPFIAIAKSRRLRRTVSEQLSGIAPIGFSAADKRRVRDSGYERDLGRG
jgi:hypothetical protein